MSVAESAVVGSVVYAAKATDEDEDRNGQITYYLVSASGPSNTFAVNLQHGLVTLLRLVIMKTQFQKYNYGACLYRLKFNQIKSKYKCSWIIYKDRNFED